jgi:hypothetical protein
METSLLLSLSLQSNENLPRYQSDHSNSSCVRGMCLCFVICYRYKWIRDAMVSSQSCSPDWMRARSLLNFRLLLSVNDFIREGRVTFFYPNSHTRYIYSAIISIHPEFGKRPQPFRSAHHHPSHPIAVYY